MMDRSLLTQTKFKHKEVRLKTYKQRREENTEEAKASSGVFSRLAFFLVIVVGLLFCGKIAIEYTAGFIAGSGPVPISELVKMAEGD